LDISRIYKGFTLQIYGQSQPGLHIQLNNIRWEYIAP
jgi:hypothetical protein